MPQSLVSNGGDDMNQVFVVVVQLLSCVHLFTTPWTAACQASLSFTITRSLFKLMSIESVMSSNHLVLCHPLLFLPSIFPSIRVFSNELALCIQTIGTSVAASALQMNIQSWFPLGLTGLISLLSKGSQESSRIPQFKSINQAWLIGNHKSATYYKGETSDHERVPWRNMNNIWVKY